MRPAVSVRAGPLPWRLGGLCGKEGPGPRFPPDEGRRRAPATSEAAKVSRFGDERRAGTSARRALSSENRVAFASRQPAPSFPTASREGSSRGPGAVLTGPARVCLGRKRANAQPRDGGTGACDLSSWRGVGRLLETASGVCDNSGQRPYDSMPRYRCGVS